MPRRVCKALVSVILSVFAYTLRTVWSPLSTCTWVERSFLLNLCGFTALMSILTSPVDLICVHTGLKAATESTYRAQNPLTGHNPVTESSNRARNPVTGHGLVTESSYRAQPCHGIQSHTTDLPPKRRPLLKLELLVSKKNAYATRTKSVGCLIR